MKIARTITAAALGAGMLAGTVVTIPAANAAPRDIRTTAVEHNDSRTGLVLESWARGVEKPVITFTAINPDPSQADWTIAWGTGQHVFKTASGGWGEPGNKVRVTVKSAKGISGVITGGTCIVGCKKIAEYVVRIERPVRKPRASGNAWD